MDLVLRVVRVARAIEHVVGASVRDHVRRPEVLLFPGGLRRDGQGERLLLPRALEEGRRSRVCELVLVESIRGLGVRDSEKMPGAVFAADEAVVVDVPLRLLADARVVDLHELAGLDEHGAGHRNGRRGGGEETGADDHDSFHGPGS